MQVIIKSYKAVMAWCLKHLKTMEFYILKHYKKAVIYNSSFNDL